MLIFALNDAATNTEINVCDITTQTEADKLAVAGRIDNVLLKNELNLMKNSENLSMYCSQIQSKLLEKYQETRFHR